MPNVTTSTYRDFLARKSQCGSNHGFEPVWMT